MSIFEHDEQAAEVSGKPQFRDVKWMTAKEKAHVYGKWCQLMKWLSENDGYTTHEPPACFTKALYEHLHQNCGHIAHYDRNGFWDAQLGRPASRIEFIDSIRRPIWPSMADYEDINGAMQQAVAMHRDAIVARCDTARREIARALIAKLAAEAGLGGVVGHDRFGQQVAIVAGNGAQHEPVRPAGRAASTTEAASTSHEPMDPHELCGHASGAQHDDVDQCSATPARMPAKPPATRQATPALAQSSLF